MIAVIGGAGIVLKVKMIPQEETYNQPTMGDNFDYDTLNVSQKQAQGDDITVSNSNGAFNIACHLAKMGNDVAFASVVADDSLGLAVEEQLKKYGIDGTNVLKVEGSTPVVVNIMNILNDPQMVFGNSKLCEAITIDVAKKWMKMIHESEAVVLDGYIPKETLEFILDVCKTEGKKVFFDPSCYNGAINSRELLEGIYCVMPGRNEAEAMLKTTVLSAEELMAAGKTFAEKGISKSIITIRGGGLYYKDGIFEGIIAPERVLSFVETSGAGDVVSAAVISADLEGKNIEEIGKHAMDMAAKFLENLRDERIIDTLNQ